MSDYSCTANQREPGNDGKVQITLFRIDGGSENHLIDGDITPEAGKMMRNVRLLDPPIEIRSFGSQPAYRAKSDVL